MSVHHLSASLLGTIPTAVEIQAVDERTDPPSQFVVKVKGEGPAAYYAAAIELAAMVGIELEG